jgi:large subunit ribosomal protein L4
MELKLVGNSNGTLNANDAVFGRDYNEALVHQVVVAFQANARIGARAQKDRGAVAHSTKKPWRQKHKVNRKMFRAGMASILSQLAREDRIRVVDEFKVDQPKTKMLAQKVKALGFDEVLVLTDEVDQNLLLSSRNLTNVQVMSVRNANPLALVRSARVLLTKGAVAKLEELLK